MVTISANQITNLAMLGELLSSPLDKCKGMDVGVQNVRMGSDFCFAFGLLFRTTQISERENKISPERVQKLNCARVRRALNHRCIKVTLV